MTQDENAVPDDGNESAGLAPAQAVIAAFGGIRPMASKLGLAVSTVQGWKERNAIPPARHAEVLAAAAAHGVDLDRYLEAPPEDASASETREPEILEPEAPPADSAAMAKTRLAGEPAEDVAPESEAAPSSAATRATRAREAPGVEPAAAAGPEPVAAPRPRGPGWVAAFMLGVAAVSLGFGGAVLSREAWLPFLAPQIGDGPATAGLSERLDALAEEAAAQRQALRALDEKIGGLATGAGGPDPAVAEAVGELASRVAALEQGAATGQWDTTATNALGELDSRVADLERSSREAASRRQESERLVAGLESRVAALEEAGGDASAARREIERLAGELAELARRTAVAEARLGDLDRIDMALATLQRESGPPAAAREVAVMLSLVQLRDALSRGAGYAAELDSLRLAIGDDQEMLALLAPLEARAENGLPTVAALARRFAPVAGAVAAAGAGEDGGLVSDLLRGLSEVVTVRRVGEIEGDGPEAVVARVEARLGDGDLKGALDALAALEGAAAAAAAEWRALAEARLAAETALTDLGRRTVERLAETG